MENILKRFPNLATVTPHSERFIADAPLTLWTPDESLVKFGKQMHSNIKAEKMI